MRPEQVVCPPARPVSAQGAAAAGAFPAWLLTPRAELFASIVAGALLLLGWIMRWTDVPRADAPIWASLAIGMFYGGRAAWGALREKRFDIDVLMVIGAGLAAGVGHPEEGALLLVLFTFAGALEELAMQRTLREVEALHALMPKGALVLRNNEWIEADADSLVPGEHIRIRPGERVPVDSIVLVGASSLDQSAITGESMPRTVGVGDELYAGTVNTDDPLEARVLRPASESSVQRILQLVTQAREQREPVQQTIDRWSQPYALGVMGVSLAVLLVWWLVLDRPLVDAENAASGAIMTAITLLIVASPCALVIATPTATLAAIARAARGGVLFKGGQAMTRLASTRAACLDKTGTLTYGRPRLYEVHPVAWSDGTRLLATAAGLERDSTHPIAQAILDAAEQRGVAPAPVQQVNHITAEGIQGMLPSADGSAATAIVRLGRYRFAEELIPVCFRNRVQEVLSKIQDRGHIAVVIATQDPTVPHGGECAVLIMADSLRPGAGTLVPELHELDVRPVRMLTGDNHLTASRVAHALGLDHFDAELLPQDKLRLVTQTRDEVKQRTRGKGGVAVIGDGVNDAPALALADVGVGIGTIGTAAALQNADCVLLTDGLDTLPWSIRLARAARRTVVVNLVLALSIIVLMGILTLVGSLLGRPVPLSLGVLAHEGGTVLVVINSLRLLAFRGPGVRSQRKP